MNMVTVSSEDGERRPYRSRLRASQAARTRETVLEAAGRCFADRGYARTTMSDIAAEAGVSVETVNLNGPKRALLLAAFEREFAMTEGAESILDRPDRAAQLAAITDPATLIRTSAEFLADAYGRSWRTWRAMEHAAAADPQVADIFRAHNQRVRADIRRYVAMVADRGGLRADLPPDEIADRLDVLLMPSALGRLTEYAGWSVERYARYLTQTMSDLLLGPTR